MTHIGSSHITRQLVRCKCHTGDKKPRASPPLDVGSPLWPSTSLEVRRASLIVTEEYSTTPRNVCQIAVAGFQILAVPFLELVTQDLRSVRDDVQYTTRSKIVKQLGIFCQLVVAKWPAVATKNRGTLAHHSTAVSHL